MSNQIVLPSTKGRDVVRFIERCCVHGEGDFYGKPFILDEWQKKILFELYETKPNGSRRYREALIGMPKGNGKTALIACIGLFELIGAGVTSPLVAMAGASKEQAGLCFNTMRAMCENSPVLSKFTECFENEIQLKGSAGRAYRVSADFKTAEGGRNSTFIADEIHEWNNERLERVHYVMANNTAKRQDGLVLNITTAGYDKNTLAGRMYQRGKKIQTGEVTDDNEFYFHWIEAEPTDDVNDPEVWKKVNPAVQNGWWQLDNLKRRHKSLPINEFTRYHLNTWTRTKEDSWLPDGVWHEQATENLQFDKELPMFLGVDMALKHDSVAVAQVQERDGYYYTTARIWLPSETGIYYSEVEQHIIDICTQYNVQEVAYDPAFFERSAQELVDRGIEMVEFPQTGKRMIPACGNAYDMIVGRKIKHPNYETFTDQVLSASQRQTDSGWRLSKGKSKRKIDACIAMVMALDRATAPQVAEAEVGIAEW